MVRKFDFNTLKKQFLPVTLPDEKKTTLLVTIPSKSLLEELIAIQPELDIDNPDQLVITELYAIVAKILSQNKNGVIITASKASKLFDVEDMILFVNAYTEFITEVANQKN